jgi:hypothetical protein
MYRRLGMAVLTAVVTGVVVGALGGFVLFRLGFAAATLPMIVGTVIAVLAGALGGYRPRRPSVKWHHRRRHPRNPPDVTRLQHL